MPPTACKLSLEIGKNDNITSSLDGRQINNTPDEPYYSYSTLLDLSAAFDCVDHDILVRRLQLAYGIEGSVSVALIIPQRPEPLNSLPLTAIRSLQPSVRCPTRLCTGPAAFPVVRR